MEPYLGMIFAFGGNFAINGFAMCSGQLLPILSNQALFSILGSYYGGNATNNFALPDLRGRSMVHQGQGPGLSNYNMGQVTGAENVTLAIGNMPSHAHNLLVSNGSGTTGVPTTNTVFAKGPSSGSGPNTVAAKSFTTAAANTVMGSQSIGANGGGQPFSILSPALTVTYLIAIVGTFPSRN